MSEQNSIEIVKGVGDYKDKLATSKQSRILIVDDEIDSVRPLYDILSKWGYDVVCLTSGKDSLEAIKSQDFDILMIDLVMPEIDGIQLIKTAQAIDPHLICIIMTGRATIQSAIEAMKVGAFDFVLKPFDFKMLRLILSRATEVRRMYKSEETYRSLVEDYQTEFICRFLPDGTLTFANEAYCRYFGKTREEIIGKSFLIFILNEDKEFIKKQYSPLDLGNPIVKHQHRVLKPDGEISWQDWTSRAIFNEHGNVIEFQSVGRDITERIRAEEALSVKNKALAESINAISISDSEGNLIYVNSSFLRLWGYDDKIEVLGKHALKFWQLEEKAKEVIEELHNRGSWIGELTAKRKDGSEFDVHLAASIFVNEVSKSSYMIGSFVDITERRKAEEALRESEEKYRVLFDQAADLIAIVDINGNFLDLNKKFNEESGWSRDEMIGKNVFTSGIITEESVCKVSFHLSQLLQGKEPPIFDVNGIRKDGGLVPYELRATPIMKDGKIAAIQAILRNIAERKRTEEKIIYMAYYDALTNLPNRYLFKERLKQELISAKQYKRLGAILFLDLDNFKRINDTLGHDTGDQLLQSVSDRLMNFVRKSDTIARLSENELENTVARLGGDEFTILLTEITHIQDAAKVAKRILDLFSQPFKIKGHELFVSASIGISIYPHNGDDVDTLLKNADTAMYHAKDQGRNNFQFYSDSMNIAILERFALENRLRKALDLNEFQLYYQPQLDIHSRTIFGVEALIRWIHPDMGALSPATFIPLAEETGLILPIGEWVLHTACAQNRAWQIAGFESMQVTVNISGTQFRQKNFVETVDKALHDAGLSPRYLELELTESILIERIETTITTLKELKAMGVGISIDDFGTGYSSLSYLKRFPIDTLKIDRSFVRDIPTDPDDKAITNAIVAMAHSLNLRVVAEGVETIQQLLFLHKQGSDGIQGYLFSPPLPVNSLTQLLKEGRKVFESLWASI